MNIPKKIVAVLSAFLIILKILLVNASAAFAPAIVGGVGIIELLMAFLSGAGYSSSELQGKSYSELNYLFGECINDGRINRNTVLWNPVLQKEQTIVDFLQSPEVQAGQKEASAVIDIAWTGWLKNALLQGLLNPPLLENVEAYVKPTLSGGVNMQGYGACYLDVRSDGFKYYNYCQYIVINRSNNTFSRYAPTRTFLDNGRGFADWYGSVGDYNIVGTKIYGDEIFYGDVRYEDGTKAETADDYEYQLGETEDGTKVTVDMLNPDGTVTIDGVTYAPSDYIDLDKFTDTAVNDLIKEINITINNINVAAPDDTKDIVDEISGTVSIDVPEELTDYVVPTGIISVFPFCIPVDIYRGFVLLSRPSVAPKIEIPFNIPAFGLFEGVEKTVTLDFSKYDKYVKIFRWFQIFGFGFLLCSVSFKKVKGV